jgi:hypothetical protein
VAANRRKLLCVIATLLLTAGLWQLGSTVYGGNPQLWQAPEGPIVWVAEKHGTDGSVTVRIGSPRNAGNRIGDMITVNIVVIASRNVQVDLTQLEAGDFVLDGASSFELAEKPRISHFQQDGKDVWDITLSVRTWEVSETVAFTANIEYLVRNHEGDLVRHYVTTPELTIFTARSAGQDDSYDLGNSNEVEVPPAPLARTFIFIGCWMTLALLVWFGIKLLPQVRVRKPVPANQRAWQVFTATFADADEHGWKEDHFVAIARQLRSFLGVESQVFEELSETLADHPERKVVLRVFRLLDEALYAKRILTESERRQLETDLGWLVPKPAAAHE